MRHILNIEYEYVRVYINSLALQAVVERCANPGDHHHHSNNNNNNGAAQVHLDASAPASSSAGLTPEGRSPQQSRYGGGGGGGGGNVPFSTLAGLYGNDQGYIKEVVDASRNLLQTVVGGLLPGGYLQHAPVRTYFRIVSGAMFLLKVRLTFDDKYSNPISLRPF